MLYLIYSILFGVFTLGGKPLIRRKGLKLLQASF